MNDLLTPTLKCFLLLLAPMTLLTSCKKNAIGGNSVLQGYVMHHSKYISNAHVFIKFNATEFPGTDTTKYDAKVTANANGYYQVKVYQGSYYLYGYGYDSQVQINNGTVTGGLSIKIRYKETINTDVPVTE